MSQFAVNNVWSFRNMKLVTSQFPPLIWRFLSPLSNFCNFNHKLRRIETSHRKTVFNNNLLRFNHEFCTFRHLLDSGYTSIPRPRIKTYFWWQNCPGHCFCHPIPWQIKTLCYAILKEVICHLFCHVLLSQNVTIPPNLGYSADVTDRGWQCFLFSYSPTSFE